MIGISMGDPNGVGPEIVLQAFAANELEGEYVVVGSSSVLERCARTIGCGAEILSIGSLEGYVRGPLCVLEAGGLDGSGVEPGRLSAEAGAAARSCVVKATELALSGAISAMVTLPVNKEAVRLTDPEFSGHTGLIARLCGTERYAMMLTSETLAVTHVSTHVSLRRAIEAVTAERILEVVELTDAALRGLGRGRRIAVAGLNPHAGEGGSFGDEEIDSIEPAARRAAERGFDVSGPIPPDTVFLKAVKGMYDAVIAMYHDQGHIPLKILDFEGGVNTTLGLPIVRTSVDHGTAFDIAYTGRASTRSLVAAYRQALLLSGKPG